MATLTDDIAAYENIKAQLEAENLGQWVVFHDKKLIGIYDDFQVAANEAVTKFGRGPYHIRTGGRPADPIACIALKPRQRCRQLIADINIPIRIDPVIRTNGINVEIGFDLTFNPDNTSRPNLPTTRHPALVDTGATESSIDSVLAEQLDLPIVNPRLITGVGGPIAVNVHLAQIRIPEIAQTIYGQFDGVHLTAGGQLHRSPHRTNIPATLHNDLRWTHRPSNPGKELNPVQRQVPNVAPCQNRGVSSF